MSAPNPKNSSSPALCRGPINANAPGKPVDAVFMGGRDKPGHDGLDWVKP